MGKGRNQGIAPVSEEKDYAKYDDSRDKWWTSDAKAEKILVQAENGIASYDESKGGIPLRTIPELFKEAVAKHGDDPALRSEMMPALKEGEKPPPAKKLTEWKTWTWKEYYNESRNAAKGFIGLGLEAHQSVCIFGFNSPEWCFAMFGAIMAGGTAAGIYPTDNEETLRYKADQSDSVVAVVENLANFQKVKNVAVAGLLPMMKAVVVWSEDPGEDFTTEDGKTIKVFTYDKFREYGAGLSDDELDNRTRAIRPGHACTLVYTSGTTGAPKATMISHDTLYFSFCAGYTMVGGIGREEGEEKIISYLPLSHVAGMMLDVVSPLGITANRAGFKGYMTVNFARSYDLRIGTFGQTLTAVRPTFFFGVPRVWEKFMEKMQAVNATQTGLKKMLAHHAFSQGSKYVRSRQVGHKPASPFMFFANIVLKKIKDKLGLDQCKAFMSGAAPMKMETLEFYGSLGIPVLEAYGMSESCAMATWSTNECYLWGSCGFELVGSEVRILDPETGVEVPRTQDLFAPTEAEQGEICFRGRSIMNGYMGNPRLGKEHVDEIDSKNAQAIDSKGWMHSGDKAARGVNGMFRITGRYKELIIGAGGENIAPVPIEDSVKECCPIISNVMMVGNKQKYNVMLITLKSEGATGVTPGSNDIAPPFDKICKTITEARKNAEVIKMVEDAIKKTNSNPKIVVSNASKVQKFTILPLDFSIMSGELTATQKLKRNVVEDMNTPIIDKMYELNGVYIDYDVSQSVTQS